MHTHDLRLAAVFRSAALLFALVGLSFLHSPASYSAEPVEKQAAAKKPAKDPNEMICKRERVTGSYMKKRICLTRAQWDEVRRESQKNAASAMQGGGTIAPR